MLLPRRCLSASVVASRGARTVAATTRYKYQHGEERTLRFVGDLQISKYRAVDFESYRVSASTTRRLVQMQARSHRRRVGECPGALWLILLLLCARSHTHLAHPVNPRLRARRSGPASLMAKRGGAPSRLCWL